MENWMPEVSQELIRAALGRRANPTFAEESQQASLWPINRYKYPIGRASTPEMQDAVQRSLKAASASVSGDGSG